ncbi:MAG: hypothetical protein ACE5HZ_08380 [Fidelibacterota bacterium]
MDNEIRKARKKSIIWGAVGGVLLVGIFFTIVSLANSFGHAIDEFTQLWYWISPLTVGFGIQVGLYAHVRQTIELKKQAAGATPAVVTAGGVSTVSMVACCAHHLTDFLPLLGLSAAAAFLSAYQVMFIILGIIANLLGITFMLSIISKHRLYFDANRWLARLAGYNFDRVFKIEIPVLVAAFFLGALFLMPSRLVSDNEEVRERIILEEQQVAGRGVRVDVAGEYDRVLGTVSLNITFTTHSGSLDFRVDKIASLILDGQEVAHQAVWEGTPPGGHHVSGLLLYDHIPVDLRTIALRLSEEGRLGVRDFTWRL